jgi:Arc/MetJ-type ribon-helix-helix transcriptional regulator
MEKLKNDLNKKGLYPSKSEILRSGLWNLRKMSVKQLEDTVKDLLKVKQIRVL